MVGPIAAAVVLIAVATVAAAVAGATAAAAVGGALDAAAVEALSLASSASVFFPRQLFVSLSLLSVSLSFFFSLLVACLFFPLVSLPWSLGIFFQMPD